MPTRGTIILIEDDPPVLSSIRRLLTREGYEVWGFADPLVAVDSIAADAGHPFDLMIIDINLPAIDGFDTSRRLREVPGLGEIPIIFVSAIHTGSEEMSRGLALGAVDYIIKPFDPDIFLKKVENFVALKQSAQRIESYRRRYHLLFEEYNDPTLILDPDGRVLEANRAARTILGIGTGEGVPALSALIHPDDRETTVRMIGDLFSGAGPQSPRLIRMRDKDGAYLWMEVNGGAFIRDTAPDAVHLTARDVTLRIALTAGLALLYNTSRRLSAALELDEIFPILVESISEAVQADRIGIITLDEDGTAVIRATTKKGAGPFSLPHPIDLGLYPEYKKVIEEKRPLSIEDAGQTPILLGQGEKIKKALVKSVLLVPIVMGERVYGIISLVRLREIRPFSTSEMEVLGSVADLAALSMERARLFFETKANEQFKSHLINVFTHEVGTPLGTIMGHTQLLMEAAREDPKGTRHLGAIFTEADRLKVIMENFLDITRLRSGKIRPKRDEVNPHVLVQKAFGDLAGRFKEKGIDCTVTLLADDLKIEGDLTLLEAAVGNVLKNALKYTPAGGTVTLTVEGRRSPSELPDAWAKPPLVSIRVADTGIGVPPEDRERIFEEFYRGQNVPDGEKGAGLGLTIVREVIEAHGGTVRLTTPERGGTVFEIILPAKT
jgi:PAS domain S-box-containing protein